jgi:hypothetical protein
MRELDIPAGTRYLFRRLSPISVGKICRQDLTARFVGKICRQDLSEKRFKYFYRTICKMYTHAHARWGVVNASWISLPNILEYDETINTVGPYMQNLSSDRQGFLKYKSSEHLRI